MDVRVSDVQKLCGVCGAYPSAVFVHRILGRSGATLYETRAHVDEAVRNTTHDISFERKIRRARFVAAYMARLPFIRAIAVCNSLGFQAAHEQSDIDLFVIAAPQRVWTARLFVVMLLRLFQLRPQEARRDPMCASFFIDASVTDMSHLMIERDIYFYAWQRALLPLYGTHALYAFAAHTAPHARVGESSVRSLVQWMSEQFARWIPESWARSAQWAKMPDELRVAALRPGTDVMCTSGIIKLHLNDRRAALRDAVYAV